jgi:phospholipid/cholesterol/gamma-HCH transport system substrate-binding protein
MPLEKKRTELMVGLFLLIGFGLLGGLVLQFGKFSDRLRGQYTLTVVFDDASGVIKGSEVRMGGAKIGQVADLPELNDSVQVEVLLAIRSSIRIPQGSTFQINSATLLGDKLIVVIPPVDRGLGFIAPDSRLAGGASTGLDALQSNAESLGKDVSRIIQRAEATFNKVDSAVNDIQSASQQLNTALVKINQSLLTEKNIACFDTTLQNLATTTTQWKSSSSKLEPALDEARLAIQAIQEAATGAEKTLNSADQALADAKPALKRLPKAVDEFASTAAKAGEALDRMKRGEGLLGALATDNGVALDAKAFMRNLREYGILLYRNPGSEPPDKLNNSSLPRVGGPHR